MPFASFTAVDAPQPSGWRKTHTWFFSGIGTAIFMLILGVILARKPWETARPEMAPSANTPSPAISPFPQNPQPVTESKTETAASKPLTEEDAAKRRAEEESAAQRRAELRRLEDARESRMRAEAEELERRKAELARDEEERLERRREEIRRQEEKAREEAANTWHVARVRNRARITVNYSVLTDGGDWRPYSVAPGATASHGRHGEVVIEFDRGRGLGTKRLTLNSSTVRTAHLSKADTDSAPASYFGVMPDGSLGIFSR